MPSAKKFFSRLGTLFIWGFACSGLSSCLNWEPSKSTSAYMLGMAKEAEAQDSAAELFGMVREIRELTDLASEAEVLLTFMDSDLDRSQIDNLGAGIETLRQTAVRNQNLFTLETMGVRSSEQRRELVKEGMLSPENLSAMEQVRNFIQDARRLLGVEQSQIKQKQAELEQTIASSIERRGLLNAGDSLESRIAAIEGELAPANNALTQQHAAVIAELEAEQQRLQARIEEIQPAWEMHNTLDRQSNYNATASFADLNPPVSFVTDYCYEKAGKGFFGLGSEGIHSTSYTERYYTVTEQSPPQFEEPTLRQRTWVLENTDLTADQKEQMLADLDSYAEDSREKYSEALASYHAYIASLHQVAAVNAALRLENQKRARQYAKDRDNLDSIWYLRNWDFKSPRFDQLEMLAPPSPPEWPPAYALFPPNPYHEELSETGIREGAVNRDLLRLRNAGSDTERAAALASLETRTIQPDTRGIRRAALEAELAELRALQSQALELEALQNRQIELTAVLNEVDLVRRPPAGSESLDMQAATRQIEAARGTANAYQAVRDVVQRLDAEPDYTFAYFDITFWDEDSQRQLFTGTSLAPVDAIAPNRLIASSQFSSIAEESVILTAAQSAPTLPALDASFFGTIKHFYRFGFEDYIKGRGAIYLNYTSQGSGIGDLTGGFSLQDAEGLNLFTADELKEFKFSILQMEGGQMGQADLFVGQNHVGNVSQVNFYGPGAEAVAGSFHVQGSELTMPLPPSSESFESFGLFGAETP